MAQPILWRRYVIQDDTGAVVNIVDWDGITPWSPGSGLTAILEADYLAPAMTAEDG